MMVCDTKMLRISSLMSSSVKLLLNVIQLDLVISVVTQTVSSSTASLRNIPIHPMRNKNMEVIPHRIEDSYTVTFPDGSMFLTQDEIH